MENHHVYWENSLFQWPFSIAILVYQRVRLLTVEGRDRMMTCYSSFRVTPQQTATRMDWFSSDLRKPGRIVPFKILGFPVKIKIGPTGVSERAINGGDHWIFFGWDEIIQLMGFQFCIWIIWL